MPKPGQKTVTLPKSVYETAKKLAEEENKSVAGKVTEIITKECNKKKLNSNRILDNSMKKEAI